MSASYSSLMQSQFFHPAFNSAIFDGPVRIYFAQFHESLALKIYFCLQQKYATQMAQAKEAHFRDGRNILVMLYPTKESYGLSFEGQQGFLSQENFLNDIVIGINGPFEDDKLDLVLSGVANVLSSWKGGGAFSSQTEAQM